MMTKTEQERNPNASEAYEAWGEFYQQMAEESMDFFRKGVENFQKMSPFYPSNELYQKWADNYQQFLNTMTDEPGIKAGDKDVFRKMYEAWMETWTRNLDSYMRSP